VIRFFNARYGLASVGVGVALTCLLVGLLMSAVASELSWKLHIPETFDSGTTPSETSAQLSADVTEAQWRSDVIAQLLAKNISGTQELLDAAPTNNVSATVLTSRAAWLYGLGLVPWADAALDAAARHSQNEWDITQQKAFQQLKASLKAAYATEQSPTAVIRDCANALPGLLAEKQTGKPNDKAYQQWQILEGPERLSMPVQLQRQELALLGKASQSETSSALTSDVLVFPSSLKPSLLEAVRTLNASQRILNNAAGVVDIGLHQRRLTLVEYNHQCNELIVFLTQQQQRIGQYKGRLQRRAASVPHQGHEKDAQPYTLWKAALDESVALITLHEAAIAALRETIEAPFRSPLTPQPASAAASIAKQLPVFQTAVTQRWQTALNSWEPVSVSQALLESGLPLSFSKALVLDSQRAVRMLTTPLPTAVRVGVSKKDKSSKEMDDEKSSKTTETKP